MEKKELNNLLKESTQCISSFQYKVNDTIAEFTRKKDAFVQATLKRYLGVDFDFRKDAESIFPRLRLLLKPDGKEEYWYNDNQHQPVLILSLQTVSKMNNNNLVMEAQILSFIASK